MYYQINSNNVMVYEGIQNRYKKLLKLTCGIPTVINANEKQPKLINQISMDDDTIFILAFIDFINTQHQHGQHQFSIERHDTFV